MTQDDNLAAADTAPRLTRTRKALIEAGKRLISSGRMDGATIDDIVREADVAKGSFYNHFPDRESLTLHVLSSVKEELLALIAQTTAKAKDAPTHFAIGMLTSFRYGLSNQVGARVLINVTSGVTEPRNPANADIVARLQRGMDDGSLKLANVDAGLVLIFGLSDLGLSRLIDLQYDRPRARDVMRGICLTLLRGLGADARRVERIVDDALAQVIDDPAAGLPGVGVTSQRAGGINSRPRSPMP